MRDMFRMGIEIAAPALVTLFLVTIAMGLAFLAIKGIEYRTHFDEGVYPGARGRFFRLHPAPGFAPFFTLYFVTTGLHAFHVLCGIIIMLFVASAARKNQELQRVEYIGIYWHFVDIVWIFLFPLLYIAK